MKNISVFFLLLIGGLFTPLAEVNASMRRVIIRSNDNPEFGVHVFCSDKKDGNLFTIADMDEWNRGSKPIYGYKLGPKKYYKSFREFSKQPEYLLHEWDSENEFITALIADTDSYCIMRKMSDETAIRFKENYLQYCVYPRKPKKYCIKD
tara:strand:+ start:222 stop:671 length:450 start_codon:yes stop_codon:yes gene_type:complete